MIATVTKAGNIIVWHIPTQENWGAFAGGFEEVTENVEYQEREDEFDIEDETALAQRKERQEEEDVDIVGQDEVEDGDGMAVEDVDIGWARAESGQDNERWMFQVRSLEE